MPGNPKLREILQKKHTSDCQGQFTCNAINLFVAYSLKFTDYGTINGNHFSEGSHVCLK